MVEKARIELKGDCPLIEDAAILAASERIAELENEASALSEALDFEREYNKQEWISVEDRLPDTGRALAIGNGCESEIVVFLKFVGGGGKFKAKGRDCTELVTHWMPLPEPPKKSGWLRDSNTHVNKLKEQGE